MNRSITPASVSKLFTNLNILTGEPGNAWSVRCPDDGADIRLIFYIYTNQPVDVLGVMNALRDMGLTPYVGNQWTTETFCTVIVAFAGNQPEERLMNVVLELKGLDIAANEAVGRDNLGYFSNWYGEY